MPEPPEVMCMNVAVVLAVHAHKASVGVTFTVPVPPFPAKLWLRRSSADGLIVTIAELLALHEPPFVTDRFNVTFPEPPAV